MLQGAMAPSERIFALLDSPDIDSVAAENRALAGQLLAAADSWLFVTTAERDDEALALLSAFGMPFRRQPQRQSVEAQAS